MSGLIADGVEGLGTSAGDYNNANGSVPSGAVECIDQLITGQAAKGIVLLRPIDGDSRKPVLLVIE